MNDITIEGPLWCTISDFFAGLVAPCKDCMRGNPVQCWHPDCPTFQFRELSNSVATVGKPQNIKVPPCVRVEHEILAALSYYGRAVYPYQIQLTSTSSKVNKSHAITRLIARGDIVEIRNGKRRLISLPKKEPENGNTNNSNNS